MKYLYRIISYIKNIAGRVYQYLFRSRFSLTLANENAFCRIGSLRFTRFKAIMTVVIVFALFIGLCVVLFRTTPLGNTISGNNDYELHHSYISAAQRLDSMALALKRNSSYLDNMKNILQGSQSANTTYSNTLDTLINTLSIDSIISATEEERQFVQSFDEAERFNLSVLSPIAAEGMTFYPPLGFNQDATNTVTTDNAVVIDISAAGMMPVSSIYRGTIVAYSYNNTDGITVTIQHPNDFISQYSGLTDAFVNIGSKVNAGTRIGIAADNGRYPLVIRMWHNGTALNPTEYVTI